MPVEITPIKPRTVIELPEKSKVSGVIILKRFEIKQTYEQLWSGYLLQQFGIVFFNLCDELLVSVGCKIILQTVINKTLHRFIIHILNECLDVIFNQLCSVKCHQVSVCMNVLQHLPEPPRRCSVPVLQVAHRVNQPLYHNL